MQQNGSETLALHAIGDCSRDSVCSFLQRVQRNVASLFCVGIPAAVKDILPRCKFHKVLKHMGLDLLLLQAFISCRLHRNIPLQLIARALGPAKQETTRFKNPSEDISDYYLGIKIKKARCIGREVKCWLCTQLGIAQGFRFAIFLQRVGCNMGVRLCFFGFIKD
ncbi:hypothetical protein CEXT_26331 [Caerostris extrusa]|uniref:Uncharacterized protein n=1 Tax=Caerostris extrusa TaxID=172846 RepID=A0AAV4QNB4_CAEEX|nr:hypothetical protein CEXT_26331 [Caerostris extrusa]